MNKILVILSREFNVRVKKKSFVILTLLGPIIFGIMIMVPIWLATSETDRTIKEILLFDESQLLSTKIQDQGYIRFIRTHSSSIEDAKQVMIYNNYFGLLQISSDLKTSILYSTDKPSIVTESNIRGIINEKLKELKIDQLGLKESQISFLNSSLGMKTMVLGSKGGENQVNAEITSFTAYLCAILIYFFIIFYASQVMRGVAEEKSSKIVEVMILSVRPFQLMIGKVLGIATVGLTQFVLWVILTLFIAGIGFSFISPSMADLSSITANSAIMPDAGDNHTLTATIAMINSLDILTILLAFLFYFITGYLLYAALFAAIGSAVGQDSDSQQFSLVVTFPLISALMLSGLVLNDPNGSIATWTSMIPFTAPVIMLTRLPFGVPAYQVLISMLIMILTFVVTIWIAGRIYRVGILAHNSKVSIKTMITWFLQK